MLSKRSTYIAITVLAALSVEIGCGDGSHKTSQRKTLDPKVGNKMVQQQKVDKNGNLMFDKSGKPMMESVPASQARNATTGGATTTGTGAPVPTDAKGNPIIKDLNVPKADPNLDVIAKQEQQTISGNPITRDDLKEGTYTLKNIVSSVRINAGVVNEETRAIQQDAVMSGGDQRLRLESNGDKNSAGMITNFVEQIEKRRVDTAVKFTVDLSNGKWIPDRKKASNVTFATFVTTPNQKAALNDDLEPVNEDNPVSILGLLATGTLQQDKSYRAEDEKGVVMYLRLLQKSANKLSVFMTFEEQRKEKDKLSFDRNLVFEYDFVPADPKSAEGGADPGITVNSNTTGKPL